MALAEEAVRNDKVCGVFVVKGGMRWDDRWVV